MQGLDQIFNFDMKCETPLSERYVARVCLLGYRNHVMTQVIFSSEYVYGSIQEEAGHSICSVDVAYMVMGVCK